MIITITVVRIGDVHNHDHDYGRVYGNCHVHDHGNGNGHGNGHVQDHDHSNGKGYAHGNGMSKFVTSYHTTVT